MSSTVTQSRIDGVLDTAEIRVETIFNKCTVVAVKLYNGFVIVESSACVDPDNYDEQLGKDICMERIENKLWELEGYVLQNEVK